MSSTAKDFMADTMVFDALADDAPARRMAIDLTRRHELVLYTTHIQEDEIAGITDEVKRWRVKSVPRRIIPSSDFIIGVSRLGMARLGGGRAYELIRHGHSHVRDAIIAATAEHEGYALATDDRRLTAQAREKLRIPVWSVEDLLKHIRHVSEHSRLT